MSDRKPEGGERGARGLGVETGWSPAAEPCAPRPEPASGGREVGEEERRESSARWVRAARFGDRQAFGEVYRLYGRLVHGVLLSLLPPAEVPDLVQEVFLQALRTLHTLRDERSFGGWIAALARNAARDHHRRPAQRARHAELNEELEAPGAGAPERAEALEILAAIRGLPEAYRETLTLRLVEGMTGPEIAAQTGLTPDSVRVNLHRGMAKLRERLEGGGR